MTHSSHRDRRIKAIAEVLAMIADAYPYPELAPPPRGWVMDDSPFLLEGCRNPPGPLDLT